MNKVNKLLFITVFILFISFINVYKVNAAIISTYTINGTLVNFREAASSTSPKIPYEDFRFPNGATLTFLDEVSAGNGCDDPWYHVSYDDSSNTYTGYVCSTFVNVTSYDDSSVAATEYEEYLQTKGFPSSYWSKLTALHAAHPNWEFNAFQTGLEWNDVISAQSEVPSSLLSKSRIDGRPTGGNVGYRSTDSRVYNWSTDTWTPIESGVWYAANAATVSYYMDPRNFLYTNSIFQFETLSYKPTYQTENVVKLILPTGNYYNLDDFSESFITAADEHDISPVHLASRVRQEGAYNNNSASGQPISCTSDMLNPWYGYSTFNGSGFYNLFNIHAVGSNVTCSAVAFASNGYNGSIYLGDGTYGRPWNTVPKSVMGGAQFLSEGYISQGQDTLYSQKFDIIGPSYYNKQYMTNIQAVSSEGISSYNAYKDAGVIETVDTSTFAFNIPVYSNMPESTSLPINKNPNSYLKSLKIDGQNITGFEYDKTSYTLLVSTSTNSITIDGTTINSEATITGAGVINLTIITITINVLSNAANDNKTTYTLTVIKSDTVPLTPISIINNMNLKLSNTYVSGIALGTTGSTLLTLASSTSPLVSAIVKNSSGNEISGTVGTGCTITLNNTLTNTTYTIITDGDTNGDAAIDIKDLLIVQKHLLKASTLSGAYYEGADVNNDGTISIKDLLIVQKHLLGITPITQ